MLYLAIYKYILISSQYLLQTSEYSRGIRDLVQSEESYYVSHIIFKNSKKGTW